MAYEEGVSIPILEMIRLSLLSQLIERRRLNQGGPLVIEQGLYPGP